jgi:uncharacterized protein YprB with RNaseH-like and TPR domain
MNRHLRESSRELLSGNAHYFSRRLPSEEQWRLFPDFRHAVAYLDIEATGVRGADAITTIALYDGHGIHCYVRGHNLDEFARDIQRYEMLVTYNGKCFDVPFIERSFGIRIEMAHIDLRFVLHSLGYTGGLKGCEKRLGIDRGALDGVDGYFAVLLWQDYMRGNERALDTLLAYNVEDVINLEALMVMAYNRKLETTPFKDSHHCPVPTAPVSPFTPDVETIRRIRGAYAL